MEKTQFLKEPFDFKGKCKMILKHYNKRYDLIMQGNLSPRRKKLMLAGIMADMESTLNIPMFRNLEWEQENEEINALYHKVSASRNL